MLKEITKKELKIWKDNIFARKCIILISGKAGAGKTTTANFIKDILERENYLVNKGGFADGVKKCAFVFFEWDGEKDSKGRKLLQNVGNTGRQYDENLWVRRSLYFLDDTFVDFIIIDDWRFPNELEYLVNENKYEVISIRVISNRENNLGNLNNDISEISLKDDDKCYDVLFYNTSTIEELKNTVKQFVDRNILKKEL